MRLVVLADVHGNLTALQAVLEDAAKVKRDLMVCLGDLVGYNAEPEPCIELLRAHCDVIVAGNHDRDVLRESSLGTQSAARMAQQWTRQNLSQASKNYLADLPSHYVAEGFVLAHGAYLSDVFISGYVTSTMLEENLMAIARRPEFPQVALSGHTHVPMFGAWDGTHTEEHGMKEAASWSKNAKAVLLNPGSVGQPRDGDTRASYGVLDLEARTFEVRRVTYDVEKTCAAIKRAGLPDELGERLREGR